MIGNQRRYCKLKEKNAAQFYDVNSTRQIKIRSASLKTQGISRYDPTLKMLTTPARLTSYPFNIGANKLLVNRANIRKHYTEILIAVRNGMRLKTSNNLIAVICVCWVLQLKKPALRGSIGSQQIYDHAASFHVYCFQFLISLICPEED